MTDTWTYTPSHIPPACGFNLLEKFTWEEAQPRGREFQESDFDFMAEHGFTFARLPMDYRCWTRDLEGPRCDIDESVLGEVVRAVELGKARGIHVCVNIHRGPGYCINKPELEPFNLWADGAAEDCFARHWRALAQAAAGFSSGECSLDLLNEPPCYGQRMFTPWAHRRVMRRAAEAIREVSPDRLIICDGHCGGHKPSRELVPLGVAQSMRGYTPFQITHYKASWVRAEDADWTEPQWPMTERGDFIWNRGPWGRERLARKVYQPWRKLQAKGVGVHCGEMGVYNRTPAHVAYAWFENVLSIFDEFGWGWALWNLRGPFGVLDTGRPGAVTEPWQGHTLDRGLLEILLRHRRRRPA